MIPDFFDETNRKLVNGNKTFSLHSTVYNIFWMLLTITATTDTEGIIS